MKTSENMIEVPTYLKLIVVFLVGIIASVAFLNLYNMTFGASQEEGFVPCNCTVVNNTAVYNYTYHHHYYNNQTIILNRTTIINQTNYVIYGFKEHYTMFEIKNTTLFIMEIVYGDISHYVFALNLTVKINETIEGLKLFCLVYFNYTHLNLYFFSDTHYMSGSYVYSVPGTVWFGFFDYKQFVDVWIKIEDLSHDYLKFKLDIQYAYKK